MKIALLNCSYFPEEPGGAEKSVRALASALQSMGNEVLVITTKSEVTDPYLDGSIRVISIRRPVQSWLFARLPRPVSRAIWHYWDDKNERSTARAQKLLEVEKPSVLHTNNLPGFSARVWESARRLKIPIVHTLRDYYLLCAKTTMFREGRNCAAERCADCRLLTRNRMRSTYSVNAVVGNSQFILDRHLQHGLFPNATKHVVFNGYEEVGKHRPRNGLIQGSKVTFGFIGRIDPTKGIEQLVECFSRVALKYRDIQLQIAGTGDPQYIRLLQNKSCEQISFIGYQDASSFFRSIDFTVLPSLWPEPLARVSFESTAHGVPVIGANTGGTPEAIEDGRNGWLYDTRDMLGLEKALETAVMLGRCGDSFKQMSTHAVRLSERFSLERLSMSYQHIYQGVVHDSKVKESGL